MHGAILNQIHALGYAVSVHGLNGTVEMHPVLFRNTDDFHVARCNDGDGEEEAYRAACLLARACGVELGRVNGAAPPTADDPPPVHVLSALLLVPRAPPRHGTMRGHHQRNLRRCGMIRRRGI